MGNYADLYFGICPLRWQMLLPHGEGVHQTLQPANRAWLTALTNKAHFGGLFIG